MCNTMVCPNPETAAGSSVLGSLTVDGSCSDRLPFNTGFGRCTIVATSTPDFVGHASRSGVLDKKRFSCKCRDQPSGTEILPHTICGSTAVCPNPYDWNGASIVGKPIYVPASATTTSNAPSTPASTGAISTVASQSSMPSKLPVLPTTEAEPPRTTNCPFPIVPTLSGCTGYANQGTLKCSCSDSVGHGLISVRPSMVCGNLMCPNVAMTATQIPGDCTMPVAALNGGIGSCELVMEMTTPPYCDCLGDRQMALSSPSLVCGEMMCPNLVKTISRSAKNEEMTDIYYTGGSCDPPTDPWINDCELMQVTSAVKGSLTGTSYCDCTHNNPTRNQPKNTRVTPLRICNHVMCPNQINRTPDPYNEITFPADCVRNIWTTDNVRYCKTTSGEGVLEPSCTCDMQGSRTIWPYPVCGMLMCPNPSGTAGVAPL